ncbi:MAG TPA: GNAT family N-acetyltransferase [Vicinamibacterales bacterium]|jgi:predicted N-acetyltransferase YhbS
MATVATVEEGPFLDQILGSTYEIWHEGLSPNAYRQFYVAQRRTAWGQRRLSRLALTQNGDVLASAKVYLFDAVLDSRPIRVAGVGAVFTQPAHRGKGAARDLVERALERVASEGADLALLFSEIGPAYYANLGFSTIATTNRTLRVTESTRYGAPATMVRGGERRDLRAIVSMGKTRAAAFRFHLDRDEDLIEYAIAKKRLFAGLGPAGARELHFFIAEEGTTAAAYVVISVTGSTWTIEECGDRDVTGARVGALLQVLIARAPAERRPTIVAWLPDTFVPPQVTIIGREPSAEVMMVKPLTAAAVTAVSLAESEILYWHSDAF